MKLSEFRFELPKNLITPYPSDNRDECRLMVVHRKTGQIEHRIFKDVLAYFEDHDAMILNDSKVFPARMYGQKEKTGSKIEVFLLRELNEKLRLWDVLVDPARKIRVGNKLYFGENNSLVAEVVDNTTSRGRTIRFLFNGTNDELKAILYEMGEMPIPVKMLGRRNEPIDDDRYQTIFSKHIGSVSAASANLHFSRELVKRLEIQGVNLAAVTSHIGLGWFRPVEVEDLTKHKSESEPCIIVQAVCDLINEAIDNKRRICAVGVSTIRSLESSVSASGHSKPFNGWTDKFLFPPYSFNIANALITNFHLPESIPLMTTAAFGGFENIMKAYEVAVQEEYKFFNYGDAMLVVD